MVSVPFQAAPFGSSVNTLIITICKSENKENTTKFRTVRLSVKFLIK